MASPTALRKLSNDSCGESFLAGILTWSQTLSTSTAHFVRGPQDNNIVLEDNLQATTVLSGALFEAWREISPYSVEAAQADNPDIFTFSVDNCMYLAAITKWVVHEKKEDADPQHNEDLLISGGEHRDQWISHDTENDDPWDSSSPVVETPCKNITHEDRWETIGLVYLGASSMQSEANIGISLIPDWRGKGLAVSALRRTLEIAFDVFQCHRVQARIMDGPHCIAARTIFIGLGFTFEGTRRRAVQTTTVGSPRDAGWRDVTYMALLDTEWVVRSSTRAAPQSAWDEMLNRHQREQEQLSGLENARTLRRTSSSETIRKSRPEVTEYLPEWPSSASESGVSMSENE